MVCKSDVYIFRLFLINKNITVTIVITYVVQPASSGIISKHTIQEKPNAVRKKKKMNRQVYFSIKCDIYFDMHSSRNYFVCRVANGIEV